MKYQILFFFFFFLGGGGVRRVGGDGKSEKYYQCYLLNLAKEWERLIKKNDEQCFFDTKNLSLRIMDTLESFLLNY